MIRMSLMSCLLSLLLVCSALTGCPAGDTTGEDHEDDAQAHAAPHGGTLVVLGGEAHSGHLELVLDAGAGTLDLYLLDGNVSGPTRIAAGQVMLVLTGIVRGDDHSDLPATASLTLAAVASAATGETAGDTSWFSGTDDNLRGVVSFTATFPTLVIRGVEHGPLAVRFPQGTEDDHDDHED